MADTIGIGWEVGVPSGWGTYGVNLAIELVRKGIAPALFLVAPGITLVESQAAVLGPALAAHRRWHEAFRQGPLAVDFPVLFALSDKLDFPRYLATLTGHPEIGVVFFESATVPRENLARARDLALIVTGSSWNADVLRRHGLANVVFCPQGVDLELFRPAPAQGRFAGRFAVFSGGKLEYRKGQDLVVAAFKRFHARHPDALLVTAWHNPWPQAAQGLGLSPHVKGAPGVTGEGRLDVAGWLRANGLPEGSFLDLGPQANAAMPDLLREVHVGLFSNRCEGGTNLVAMECMACGVAPILSRNTGHLDLIGTDRSYSLDLQIPMGAVTGRADLEGWGESSIDEAVAALERAYGDRDGLAARGAAAARFMEGWGWSRQVDRLLAEIAAVSGWS